jgi:hypothetical protein
MIRISIKMLLFALCSMLFIMKASAEEARIYQQDEIGNTQYHKPSAAIQSDGRIVETDSVGNKQYHKQQYQIKDGKVYQTDSVGNIQYHKPHVVIKKTE